MHACYLSSPAIYHQISQEQGQLSSLRLQASVAALLATDAPPCAAQMPHTCRAAAVQCVFITMLCNGEYQSHLLACWPKLRKGRWNVAGLQICLETSSEQYTPSRSWVQGTERPMWHSSCTCSILMILNFASICCRGM